MTDGKTSQELKKIEAEMMACYNGWDGAIKNKQQPVTIQDLEYWAGVCRNLAMDSENENQRLRTLVEALVSKSESLMQRARAMDIKLLGKTPEVELGEITRLEVVIQNAKTTYFLSQPSFSQVLPRPL